MKRIFALLLLIASGCSQPTKEEMREKIGAFCGKLTEELGAIRTREQLLHEERRLHERFEELVDLIAVAETLRRKEGVAEFPAIVESQALEKEFLRLEALEGGREVIERAQKEPLIRLAHLFERERGKSGEPLSLFIQR